MAALYLLPNGSQDKWAPYWTRLAIAFNGNMLNNNEEINSQTWRLEHE